MEPNSGEPIFAAGLANHIKQLLSHLALSWNYDQNHILLETYK